MPLHAGNMVTRRSKRLIAAGLFTLRPFAVLNSCGNNVIRVVLDGSVPPDSGSVTATIGPAGGVVRLGDASIVIPSGALSRSTPITLSVSSQSIPASYDAYSALYQFGPAGLTFAVPATVRLPETRASSVATVLWSTSDGSAYSSLPTHIAAGMATAEVSHFSLGFLGTSATDAGFGDGDGTLDASSESSEELPPDASDEAVLDASDEPSCSTVWPGVSVLMSGLNSPRGVVSTGTDVYVAAEAPDAGVILKVPVGGGTPTTFASGAIYPLSLSLDSTNVYWVAQGGGSGSSGAVLAATLDGGSVSTLAYDLEEPTFLAVSGPWVCWVELGTDMLKGKNLVNGETLNLSPGGNPANLAVNSSEVFWSNGMMAGSVNSAELDGGPGGMTLATGLVYPGGIAADDTNVYWANGGSDGHGQSVMQVPIEGGTPTVLSSGGQDPSFLVIDEASVYWTDVEQGTVLKVPIGGGTITTLAAKQFQPTFLAVDGANVYWASQACQTVLKASK
jgi:hypothetical protein